jgi:hypothetical protein
MSTRKNKAKNSRSHRRRSKSQTGMVSLPIKTQLAFEMPVPEPVTDVVTENTYVTTAPEVEIRKPATLAQALTEPAVAVVKPKTRVRKEVVARSRRTA